MVAARRWRIISITCVSVYPPARKSSTVSTRDTSGCLALGRHAKALRRLNGLFAERRVTKIYHAWLDAIPADQNGIIDCPIAPIDPLTPWRVIADPEGLRPGAQPAQTRWQVLEKRDSRALVELRPVTGAHASAAGALRPCRLADLWRFAARARPA